MKQLLTSCVVLLLGSQVQAQSIEKITTSYELYDSLQVQEKVYAQTDRSLYKPGDNIWFNAFVSTSANGASDKSEEVYAELISPKGSLIKRLTLSNQGGCARGNFQLSPIAVGGRYKLRVYSYWMQNFSKENYFEKNLTVQKVSIPDILMKMDFEREAYGAGDQVVATFSARTKDNKALANKTLTYTVALEGELLCKKTATSDKNGEALIVFQLPQKLNSNDNLVNVQLQQDGLTESISRSAPIVLNNLDIQLLPEGGNMIAGYLNRIGVKVLNEFGKPADIKAEIVDKKGQIISDFETFHQGMGAFDLTPQKGEKYFLKVLSPQGIDQKWELPTTEDSKIGIYVRENRGASLALDIYSPARQQINIVAQQNGKLVHSQSFLANQGANLQQIPIANLPIGILQITLFDAQQQPHAERLVFINKDRKLSVAIKTNKKSYSPREKVKMDIVVTDETGKAVQGNFSMAVVDDKQHTFADDKQDDILSFLLMSSDLKGDIYEPNFYFNPQEEKANKALDYVMLTHGWRRFDWQSVLLQDSSFALNYKMDNKEISGYLKIGDKLAKNQQVFLSEGQARFTKKKAVASLHTDENGFFRFKNVDIKFPAFLSATYHGDYHAIPVYVYSKTGAKRKNIVRHSNKTETTFQYEYKPKVANRVLRGIVISKADGLELIGVEISIKKEGKKVARCLSDMSGNFSFGEDLPEGIYSAEVMYLGFQPLIIDQLSITKETTLFLEVDMVQRNASQLSSIIAGTGNRTKKRGRAKGNSPPNNQQQEVKSRKKNTISPIEKVTENTVPTNSPRNAEDLPKLRENSVQSDELKDQIVVSEGQVLVSESERIVEEAKKKEYEQDEIISIDKLYKEKIDEKRVERNQQQLLEDRKKQLDLGGEIITDGTTVEVDVVNLDAKTITKVPAASGEDISQSLDFVPGTQRTQSLESSNSNRYNVNSRVDGGYDFEQLESSIFIEQIKPKRQVYSVLRKFYTPNYSKSQSPSQRTDFRKTIYWNPSIKTNEQGKASVFYYNSDEVTTFRAILEGNSSTGKLAHAEQSYHSILPFSITTKIPKVLSFGDKVKIPVLLKNNTKKEITGSLSVVAPQQLERIGSSIPVDISIDADSHKVVYLEYKVLFEAGFGRFQVAFESQKLKDKVNQQIEIAPKGFPVTFAMAGQVLEQTDTFVIEDAYEGSMESELKVYPDILDGLMDGVESILNSPSGCFEQVSSSNYPNILALQLMEQSGKIKPAIRKKALGYLQSGYSKLAAYEIKGGGFDWYGRPPAHEGLTAYGLVQFEDMKEVYDGVKSKMISRTKDFLLQRRDGKGGFEQNVGKYGFSGNKPALFNAYITWALSEAKTKGIAKEVEAMTKEAIQSEDLYRMSLACLTHYNQGNTERADLLLQTIQDIIKKVGIKQVKAQSTVTYSYGKALNIETLSFAALSMMQSDKCDEVLLVNIIKHILSLRQYGRFGSTQSTIMALRTLSAYHKMVSKVREDGRLMVYVNGKLVKEHSYKKDDQAQITIKGLYQHFVAGKNTIRVKFEGAKNALPYSFDAKWTAATPQSHIDCPLKLQSTFSKTKTKVGETVRMQVELQNLQSQNLPSTMALIGIPAGLSLQPWQLKEMQEKQAFAFYELKDNYLILYYREIEANEKKILPFDLKAEVPGIYTAPANATYLYYGEEYKHWSAGTSIEILSD